MKTLGEALRCAWEEKNLILRKIAFEVDIDQTLISKFEKNERKPKMEQLGGLGRFYVLYQSERIINWPSEKIADKLKHTESTLDILKVGEEKINYYIAQENGK
jgi:HTH-type transcriptional regulator, competence development regulator